MIRMKISTMALAVLLASSTTWAADTAEEPAKEPTKEPPKDAKKLGSDEAACHTFDRAGYPLCLSRRAQGRDAPGYCGYFVGGGSVRAAGSVSPPCPNLGQWGRDWCGIHFHPKVMLGWAGRYQDGLGAYSQGHRDIPDVVAKTVALPEILHHHRQEKYCPEGGGHCAECEGHTPAGEGH